MVLILYIVLLYITSNNRSDGRMVQAIIGRNVSFSFTLVTKDVIKILHNNSRFLLVWPDASYHLVPEYWGKMRISVDLSASETIKVILNILNITKNDSGKYSVEKRWDSKEFNISVFLETIEDTMIPRIDVVRRIPFSPHLELQCNSSSLFARKYFWKLNATLIENQGRYSLSNNSLWIWNLTSKDQYNLYACVEEGSVLESDPLRIKSYGPSEIKFIPNETVVHEHDSLNISCNSDCYPVCSLQWSKQVPFSGVEKALSDENMLQIDNVTKEDEGTYSCKVQNLLSGNTLANYLSLTVLYNNSYLSTATSQKDDTDTSVITYYMTTAKSHEEDTEGSALPSTPLFTYLVLGFGIMFAIGVFTCLLQKFLKCIRVERVEDNIPLQDSGEENQPEENRPEGSYWTIVSNAKGELSTAVEINTEQIIEQNPICNKTDAELSQLEESPQFHGLEDDMDLDGYMHHIPSNPLNTSFASAHDTTDV